MSGERVTRRVPIGFRAGGAPPSPAVAGPRSPEAGAAIILAIAFLTIVITLSLVLFGQAFTTTTSGRSYRAERTMRYGVDAALQSGVQLIKSNPLIGLTVPDPSNPSCALQVPLREDTAGGTVAQVVASNSYVNVSCAPTTGATSGGIDSDGGQLPRDVIITVRCNRIATSAAKERVGCTGAGGEIVGQARVRYDMDYLASNQLQRATVPKVVWWRTSL